MCTGNVHSLMTLFFNQEVISVDKKGFVNFYSPLGCSSHSSKISKRLSKELAGSMSWVLNATGPLGFGEENPLSGTVCQTEALLTRSFLDLTANLKVTMRAPTPNLITPASVVTPLVRNKLPLLCCYWGCCLPSFILRQWLCTQSGWPSGSSC